MNAVQRVNKLREDLYNVISTFEDETGLTVEKVGLIHKAVFKPELKIKQHVVCRVEVNAGVL